MNISDTIQLVLLLCYF